MATLDTLTEAGADPKLADAIAVAVPRGSRGRRPRERPTSSRAGSPNSRPA